MSVIRRHRTLYQQRQTKRCEFIYAVSQYIERIHLERLEGDDYQQIRWVHYEMDLIRVSFGLEEDQHWLVGHGPPEYERLSALRDIILRERLAQTYRELGVPELARLLETDPSRFERLRNQGRHSAGPARKRRNLK